MSIGEKYSIKKLETSIKVSFFWEGKDSGWMRSIADKQAVKGGDGANLKNDPGSQQLHERQDIRIGE